MTEDAVRIKELNKRYEEIRRDAGRLMLANSRKVQIGKEDLASVIDAGLPCSLIVMHPTLYSELRGNEHLEESTARVILTKSLFGKWRQVPVTVRSFDFDRRSVYFCSLSLDEVNEFIETKKALLLG